MNPPFPPRGAPPFYPNLPPLPIPNLMPGQFAAMPPMGNRSVPPIQSVPRAHCQFESNVCLRSLFLPTRSHTDPNTGRPAESTSGKESASIFVHCDIHLANGSNASSPLASSGRLSTPESPSIHFEIRLEIRLEIHPKIALKIHFNRSLVWASLCLPESPAYRHLQFERSRQVLIKP